MKILQSSETPLGSLAGSHAVQEMYDLDLAQFDKIAVTLDKFKIGVEGASGVWVDAGTWMTWSVEVVGCGLLWHNMP